MSITPAKWGKCAKQDKSVEPFERTPMEQHVVMTRARRLKRVFNIDITECQKCHGPVKIIACIEETIVIKSTIK